MDPALDPLTHLTTRAEVVRWEGLGLPPDRNSTENAALFHEAQKTRWPLLIDPQGQGVAWVKRLWGLEPPRPRTGLKKEKKPKKGKDEAEEKKEGEESEAEAKAEGQDWNQGEKKEGEGGGGGGAEGGEAVDSEGKAKAEAEAAEGESAADAEDADETKDLDEAESEGAEALNVPPKQQVVVLRPSTADWLAKVSR